MAYSPLYYRQAGADIKEKLEEYKKKKAIEEKKNAVVIFDTKEFSEWQYMYEPKHLHFYQLKEAHQLLFRF